MPTDDLLGNDVELIEPLRNRKLAPKVKYSRILPWLHKQILKTSLEGSEQ